MDFPIMKSIVLKKGRRAVYTALPGILLLFGGCASSEPKPDAQIAHSVTVVDQAERAGSRNYAAFDLVNAQTKLEKAKKFMNEGQYKNARFLAEEAGVDAELAMAKTQTLKAKEAEDQLMKSIQLLEKEITPSQSQ